MTPFLNQVTVFWEPLRYSLVLVQGVFFFFFFLFLPEHFYVNSLS